MKYLKYILVIGIVAVIATVVNLSEPDIKAELILSVAQDVIDDDFNRGGSEGGDDNYFPIIMVSE